MKLIVVSNVMANRSVASLIKFIYRFIDAKLLILLGNVISPKIIDELVESGITILGVPGSLDEASFIQALKKTNSFAESRVLDLNNYRVFFIGVNINVCLEKAKSMNSSVNVLFTHYPPCSCRYRVKGCLKWVDDAIELLKPSLVVNGGCGKQCLFNNCLSPGNGYLGEALVLDTYGNSIRFINIYELLKTC